MAMTVFILPGVAADMGTLSKERTNVEEVVERYIRAVGDRAALEKLATRICAGKETTDLTSREKPLYESHWFEDRAKMPFKYLLTTWTGGGIEKVCRDGETGWVKDRCGVREDKEAIGTKLAFLFDPQGPLHIAEYFPNLEFKGTQDMHGRSLHRLDPGDRDPAHYALFFDVEGGLLVGIGYYWELKGYREIDGVLFPFSVETSRKGGSTVYEFEEVTHNEKVGDEIFVMPTE